MNLKILILYLHLLLNNMILFYLFVDIINIRNKSGFYFFKLISNSTFIHKNISFDILLDLFDMIIFHKVLRYI